MNARTTALRRIAEKELGIPATLHDYQWQGVAFLYRATVALLADEMGLGKTVQSAVAVALLLNTCKDINRVLIVAPASLTLNWLDEFEHWTPAVTARRLEGSYANRQALYLLPIPVLVGSYEQIRMDGLDRIPTGTFDLVVLDEAQRIKNRHSTTALAARLLPRKRAWALSATPLENDRKDVESLLSFLDSSFRPDFTFSQLSRQLTAVMLRRRKAEVQSQLPPILLQDIRLDLSSPQRAAYDNLWERRHTHINAHSQDRIGTQLLGLITRLKIVCNYDVTTSVSSKLDALLDLCESAGPNARIIVFSQFVETLSWISDRLPITHEQLTGAMPVLERHHTIDRFTNGLTPRVLLISLRAGGVGLNLDNATHVVLFDRWWNPAVEMQAIYRAHRFERDQPLHVIRFLVVRTIEERISAILDKKQEIFEEIIDSTPTESKHFSVLELMQILELPVSVDSKDS